MIDELAPDASDEFRAFVRDAPHEWSAAIMGELRRLMPRSVIDSLAVVGTPGEIVRRLQALEAAGIGEVIIWPFPKDGQTTEDFILRLAHSVMPFVGGRSAGMGG